MAKSFARSVASGLTAVFSVPFPYLDKTHVSVFVDGTLLDPSAYSWPTTASVELTAGAPVAGAVVERRRITPSEVLTTFTPGNLEAADLNSGVLQPLYLAQEADDKADDTALRAWYTNEYGAGGLITKGTVGQIPLFDADGNLSGSSVLPDPSTGDALLLKSTYDPQGIEGDAFDRGNHTGLQEMSTILDLETILAGLGRGYNTRAELEAATVPLPVQRVKVLGYWAAGDGGAVEYERTVAPEALGAVTDDLLTASEWIFDSNGPERWSFVNNPQGRTGARALRTSGADYTVSGTTYQRAILADYHTVTPGKTYIIEGTVNAAGGASGTAQLGVYWYNASNLFLSSSYISETVDVSLQFRDVPLRAPVIAPAGAAFGRIVVRQVANSSSIIGGTVDFYDMAFSAEDYVEGAYLQTADGAWWEMVYSGRLLFEMFGATPVVAVHPDTLAWYNAHTGTKPTFLHLMHEDRMIKRMHWRNLWAKLTALVDFGATNVGDAGRNLLNPTTGAFTFSGTGTFTPGKGWSGNGSHTIAGPLLSTLFTQDAGFFSLNAKQAYPHTGGYLVSSAGGTANGIAYNPWLDTNGRFTARFASGSTLEVEPRTERRGRHIISRDNSANIKVWEDGELFKTIASTSVAFGASNLMLLGSGTGEKSTDMARMFVAGDVAIDQYDADALDWIMDTHVRGLGGVVGVGPSAESIGFTSSISPAQRLTRMNYCVRFARRYGATITAQYGTYLMNGTLCGITAGVKIKGVHRQGSIFACADGMEDGIALVAPGHFNGGDKDWEIAFLTLDGRCLERGILGVGTYMRPGPSTISTNGAWDGSIHDCDLLDPVLHNIDYCNTGEMDGLTRQYSALEHPDRWDAGIRSKNIKIYNILGEQCGDDHITLHYADGGEGFVHNIAAYFSSGRHEGGASVSMAVEADDGSRDISISKVYGRGLGGVVAAKNHQGNPAPFDVRFKDIISECSGRGVQFINYDNPALGTATPAQRGRCSLDGLIYTRPRETYPGHEVHAVLFSGAEDCHARNLMIKARGDETFLRAAIHITNCARRSKVSDFTIENWQAKAQAGDATIRLVGSTIAVADTTIENGTIRGAGQYAFRDTGGARTRVRGLTLSGTGAASSRGLSVETTLDSLITGIIFADTYVAGVSGFETPIVEPNFGTAVYNPASLADGAGVTTTVAVAGAIMGARTDATFSLDLQGVSLTSWVSAVGTVSVRFQNETGGVIDLASGTLNAWVRKAS